MFNQLLNITAFRIFFCHVVNDTVHPYQSRWYTWPLMGRPMFYYMGKYLPNGISEGISSFGNPAIWWSGIFAFVWLVITVTKFSNEHDLNSQSVSRETRIFLIISLLAQIVPWMFVKRSTYIYHYFATTPFLMMCIICWFIDSLKEKSSKKQLFGILTYLLVCLVLFALFYPVLTGIPVASSYCKCLRWFPSWVLYAYWL